MYVLLLQLLYHQPFCLSLQDLKKVAFRFKDKERPRDYTSKIAGLLQVGPTANLSGVQLKLKIRFMEVFRKISELKISVFKQYSANKFLWVLQHYPLEEVLSAEYFLEDFKPDLIEMVLDKLRPEHVRSV